VAEYLPEEIYTCRYELRAAGALNARTGRREFEGALIRLRDGFACLHPWPELGDPPLEELLQMMKDGRGHRLIHRALACAALDRHARKEGRSLFTGLAVPDSHATIVEWTHESIEVAVVDGFETIKLKGGHDLVEEAKLLSEWARLWPELRWRIDFNGALSYGEVRTFLECLPAAVLERMDFLEDPCRFAPQEWLGLREAVGVPLAMDEHLSPDRVEPDVLVLKPAVLDLQPFLAGALEHAQGLVVTSYMDHPLGQCFAAVEAGLLMNTSASPLVGRCGLLTQGLFEETAFSERLGGMGPAFSSPAGTGLGFDDLLEGLSWKRLH
jgi:O-succinylbenzoate synthase